MSAYTRDCLCKTHYLMSNHPLKDLSQLDKYSFPVLTSNKRFQPYKSYIKKARAAGKYIVAPDTVELFERMRSLMGLENLLDILTDLTIGVIR